MKQFLFRVLGLLLAVGFVWVVATAGDEFSVPKKIAMGVMAALFLFYSFTGSSPALLGRYFSEDVIEGTTSDFRDLADACRDDESGRLSTAKLALYIVVLCVLLALSIAFWLFVI